MHYVIMKLHRFLKQGLLMRNPKGQKRYFTLKFPTDLDNKTENNNK